MSSTSIQALVKTTLENAAEGVPVQRIRYDGKAETFITFQRIFRASTAFEDDAAGARQHTFGADIYSKTNPDALVDTIEGALSTAGFDGVTIEAEIYESETGYYHVPITFYYTEVL